eukprot:2196140-Alexandrium_andersonii.AAC.1
MRVARMRKEAIAQGGPQYTGPYMRVATRSEVLAMAEGDDAFASVRASRDMRVMVAVDPEVVRLVESREGLRFVWTQA